MIDVVLVDKLASLDVLCMFEMPATKRLSINGSCGLATVRSSWQASNSELVVCTRSASSAYLRLHVLV